MISSRMRSADARSGRLAVRAVPRRDPGHPIGGRPAHQAREGLRPRSAAAAPRCPRPGSRHRDRLPGQAIEQIERLGRALGAEPVVEEDGAERQHHLAEHVVLPLRGGRVADPDRALASEARPVVQDALLEVEVRVDPVERGQVQVRARAGHVDQVVDELLALLEVPQQPEGRQGVVGVAQPAVAVVPRPAASGRLGDRGRHRRDDGPRVLEAVELQRQGRADHLLLEERRDVAVLDPALPVARRLVEEALAQRPAAAPRSARPR